MVKLKFQNLFACDAYGPVIRSGSIYCQCVASIGSRDPDQTPEIFGKKLWLRAKKTDFLAKMLF